MVLTALKSRNIFNVFSSLVLVFLMTNGDSINLSTTLSLKPEFNNSLLNRCPQKANKSGIYFFNDKKLCNVFHECYCTEGNNSLCSFVKSNVCPIGTVFINNTNKCEPIEIYGCETSYLQWISSMKLSANSSETLEKDYEVQRKEPFDLLNKQDYKYEFDFESANITGVSEFVCPVGSNERFADPQICNIFHVCVSRGDQTYDQPFLCPFSSVFRVLDSKTMYCDKKTNNDCKGKAFYRSIDDEDTDFGLRLNSVLIEKTLNVSYCMENEKFEDKLFCNTFHLCKGRNDEHYMCENNLLFNPLSLLCDYPINVPCYNKQIFKKKDPNAKEKKLENSSLIKNFMQNFVISQNQSVKAFKNGTLLKIYGIEIDLKCPFGIKNYLFPDKNFCNIFHHCHGYSGNILVCEKGQAFDATANGPEKSGVCNFENLVNCEGKFILTENGQRKGKPSDSNSRSSLMNLFKSKQSQEKSINNLINEIEIANTREELVTGIPYDCRGKMNGHWRDHRYCDVFHACISNEQKKTYSCAQLGERIYFDETTKRCEFTKNNPSACIGNIYFQQVIQPQSYNAPLMFDEPNEAWKQFIRLREHFSCAGKLDGFYASRWCNVFYRCFLGVKTEFLCPKMLNSDRLWWIQHGSSQETPQTSAACVWPCETKKPCLSPGGSVIENGDGSYSENLLETDRVWRSSSCAEESSLNDIFKISDSDFSCSGLSEGNFYSSKYCNIFHRCTNGKRKDFRCAKATNSPYDLWWNEATNQCDWPCKINCMKPVYGSQKSAMEIQSEDRSLNEEECRKASNIPFVPASISMVSSKQIIKPFPDENFICPALGSFASLKYCNVYYECKAYGNIPSSSFYCEDGHFDSNLKTCRQIEEFPCFYSPPLLYPYISISEINLPEEVGCSNTIGYYIIHSNRYCNVFYICDGRLPKPQSYRCFDRENLVDAFYNKEAKRCEAKQESSCSGEIFSVKLRYQSSPVDHTRLSDLQALSCRADQQYLAEHDKFCNLYHSCILGKYQMYACITIGSFDRTSFFYYTNGDCAAPNSAQCGSNKSIYPYEKLFQIDSTNIVQNQGRFLPVISSQLNSKNNYGTISLKKNLPLSPICDSKSDFTLQHQKFCNLYYECNKGKLTTFICVDTSTGKFGGIFDKNLKFCKPNNNIDCPTNSLFYPDEKNFQKNYVNENYEISSQNKFQMDLSFRTESNFSCYGRKNGYYESEWCNIYFRCINGKRIDSKCSSGIRTGEKIQYDLWWEHQNISYDSTNPMSFNGNDENAKCEWPCKIKCNKKVWIGKGFTKEAENILKTDIELHPECLLNKTKYLDKNPSEKFIQQFKLDSNPSSFSCDDKDGIFQDKLFCNIYHLCKNKELDTFMCKTTNEGKEEPSLFDFKNKKCVTKEESFSNCNGIIYDTRFSYVSPFEKFQTLEKCSKSGIFRAKDKEQLYCDIFYWCERSNSMPFYFYCESKINSKSLAIFDMDSKQCEYKSIFDCPFRNKIYNINSNYVFSTVTSSTNKIKTTLNNLNDYLPFNKDNSNKLDPAPGYMPLSSNQFSSHFRCPPYTQGYFPDSEYCDIFHYCYPNGKYFSFVCPLSSKNYQLWWSQEEFDDKQMKIKCEFPCNLIDSNSCSSNKKILIKDNKITRGISRQEVLSALCSNSILNQSLGQSKNISEWNELDEINNLNK